MKFSKRMGFVGVCVMSVLLWAGFAWAGTPSVEVIPTLDSTGEHLSLEFSFYDDGQKVNEFAIFSDEDLPIWQTYFRPRVTIRKANGEDVFTELVSDTAQYYADKVIAEFTLSVPLEEFGSYLIFYKGQFSVFIGGGQIPEELEDTFRDLENKYWPWLGEHERYWGATGNYGQTNGGQPIRIVQEGSIWPSTYISINHVSEVFLADGKPNYDSAVFGYISFALGFNPVLKKPLEEWGTFNPDEVEQWTLVDNDGNVYSHDGNHNIDAGWVLTDNDADYMEYTAVFMDNDDPDKGGFAYFRGISQSRQVGLPKTNFDWSLGLFSGSGTVYDFYTTDEQIAQGVAPYIELTDSALRYKITAPFAGKARIRIRGTSGPWLYDNSWDGANKIEFSGSAIEGSIDFAGNNLTKDNIVLIRVDLRPNDSVLADGSSQRYRWHFRVPPTSAVTPPADSDANTQTTSTVGAGKTNVSVAVTGRGGTPILEDMWFNVWLEESVSSAFVPFLFSAKTAYAAGNLYGPFSVKSRKNGNNVMLDIDVNNLRNLDGSKSSVEVASGWYKIKFQAVDTETEGTNYVGITDTIELVGTASGNDDPPSGNDNPPSSGGGGGCNAGYGTGMIGLLLAGFVTRNYRKA
jgi:hypothetical protein